MFSFQKGETTPTIDTLKVLAEKFQVSAE